MKGYCGRSDDHSPHMVGNWECIGKPWPVYVEPEPAPTRSHKRARIFIGAALIGGSFGVCAARIMHDNGRIDGVFLAAFLLAVIGVLVLPMDGRE